MIAAARVALVALVLLAGCSSDGGSDSSSTTTKPAKAEAKGLALGKAGACSLLDNDEVTAVVGSPVIGSSPAPGGDDACTFAYGASTTVAPPDGPHLTLVVRRKAKVGGAVPISGVGIDGTWDAKAAALALQFRDGSVTIDLPAKSARTDAEALAKALVVHVRTPPPAPTTTITTTTAKPG